MSHPGRGKVMARRGRPDWWGACAEGWCGGAFLCQRHAELLPALEAWLFDESGSEPFLGSPAPDHQDGQTRPAERPLGPSDGTHGATTGTATTAEGGQ